MYLKHRKKATLKISIYKSRSRTVMLRFKFQDRKARKKNQPFKETIVVLMVNFFLKNLVLNDSVNNSIKNSH
jgi:hypothetical protein